jgi:hypothetical protein
MDELDGVGIIYCGDENPLTALESRAAEAEGALSQYQRRDGRVEFYEVLGERIRQDKKWGEQNHDDWKWLAILVEEVGEAAQAMMQAFEEKGDPANIHKEVLEATAVGLAWLECIRRRAALRSAASPGGLSREPGEKRQDETA